MTKMTTEEAFIKVLQKHGIQHSFGIIGSAFMPISDLFPKAGITFWDVAHETNGGIMAEIVADVQENFNDWLDSPIIRVGAKDVPWPYNKNLESNAYPDSSEIVEDILSKMINK